MTLKREIKNVTQYAENDIYNINVKKHSEREKSEDLDYIKRKKHLIRQLIENHNRSDLIKRAVQIYAKKAHGTSFYKELKLSQLKDLLQYSELLIDIKESAKPIERCSFLDIFKRMLRIHT